MRTRPHNAATRSSRLPPLAAALVLSLFALAGAVISTNAAIPLSFAVIGDVPYGKAQFDAFPGYIAKINADPDVRLVSHLGDLSEPLDCSSAYYLSIRSQFDLLEDPLIYTPGDNEWADCWRAPTGAGAPLGRLDELRRVFFPAPGTSLGSDPIPVAAQPSHPENVTFDRGGLTFAAFHAVGSANGLVPWYGESSPYPAQTAEVAARIDAAVTLITYAFVRARAAKSRAVVLITQANMFVPDQGRVYRSGYQEIVRAIAEQSRSFDKPVFLINGDTHSYRSDKPLTESGFRTYYGIPFRVMNLSRITVEGGTGEWTKFTVVPTPEVLQWQRVPSS